MQDYPHSETLEKMRINQGLKVWYANLTLDKVEYKLLHQKYEYRIDGFISIYQKKSL